MQSRPRILVVGNAVLDVLVASQADLHATCAQPRFGENTEFLHHPIEFALGGNGASAAYVLAKLGADVALLSNLGCDLPGQVIRSWLAEPGVEVLATDSVIGRSAVHDIHSNAQGRLTWYYRGEQVPWLEGQRVDCSWVLVAAYGASTHKDIAPMLELAQAHRHRGARVVFDPGPWLTSRATFAQMHALLRCVDVLTATEDELTSWFARLDRGSIAQECLSFVRRAVVFKRGAKGASYYTDGEQGEVAAVADGSVNTVGAGDVFNARLTYGLARGDPLASSVQASVCLASLAVARGRGALGAFEQRPVLLTGSSLAAE